MTALLSTLGAGVDPQLHRVLPQMHNLTTGKSGKAILSTVNRQSMAVPTPSPNVPALASLSTGGYNALSLSNAPAEAAASSVMSANNTTITIANNGNNNSIQLYAQYKDNIITNK